MSLELSVVIPVRDEARNVNELSRRISQTMNKMGKSYEVIFVTDINKDNTMEKLCDLHSENHQIKVLKLTNGYGQHVAVYAGLERTSGDYVVIMDGDLQDYPEDIEKLYSKIREGYDIVYATKQKKNDSGFRNISSKLFNKIMNKFSDVKIDSNSSMFRIVSRKAVNEVLRFREFEPSLTYIFSYISLQSTNVEVTSGERLEGETKYSFMKLVNFAISSLVSFSRKPLRMISVFGIVISGLSFLFLMVTLLQWILFGVSVPGWTTIILVVSFLGGFQILCIGIIGEYLGRVYMETKRRPMYIVERELGDLPLRNI